MNTLFHSIEEKFTFFAELYCSAETEVYFSYDVNDERWKLLKSAYNNANQRFVPPLELLSSDGVYVFSHGWWRFVHNNEGIDLANGTTFTI